MQRGLHFQGHRTPGDLAVVPGPLVYAEVKMVQGLGKVAYEAYGESVDWTTFSGQKMPTWDEQNDRLKQAWNSAAEAVARRVREE